MPDGAALERVHERLRRVLVPYRRSLAVTRDGPDGLTLEVPGMEGKPAGFAAGTRAGKRYVSFYLMPVYRRPELLSDISSELRRRMQGKSCFNFARLDEPLMAELERLVAAALPGYADAARAFAETRVKR